MRYNYYEDGKIFKFIYKEENEILYESKVMWKDVCNFMSKGKIFKDEFIDILKKCKFKGYMIKCNKYVNDKYFKFVIIKYDYLSYMQLDKETYKEYFKKEFNVFPNISGDTILISPSPYDDKTDYRSIGPYFRTSTKKTLYKLLECISKNLFEGCYLNTHGLGVSYIHIRIDLKPKYYSLDTKKMIS